MPTGQPDLDTFSSLRPPSQFIVYYVSLTIKQPLLLPVSSSGHGKLSCQLERLLAVLEGWLGGSLMEIKPNARGAGFLLPAAKSNTFVVQTLSGWPGCCLFSSGRLDPAGPQDCVPSSHFPPCCEVSSYPQAASAVTPTYVMLNWIARVLWII